jgi:hypothetical protein
MATRDYHAEYEARKARGAARGETIKQSRGHIGPLEALRDPDRYHRWLERHPDTLAALRDSDAARKARDEGLRKQEAADQVVINWLRPRPDIGEHRVHEVFPTLRDARSSVAARAVSGYTRIVYTPQGYQVIISESGRFGRKPRKSAAQRREEQRRQQEIMGQPAPPRKPRKPRTKAAEVTGAAAAAVVASGVPAVSGLPEFLGQLGAGAEGLGEGLGALLGALSSLGDAAAAPLTSLLAELAQLGAGASREDILGVVGRWAAAG